MILTGFRGECTQQRVGTAECGLWTGPFANSDPHKFQLQRPVGGPYLTARLEAVRLRLRFKNHAFVWQLSSYMLLGLLRQVKYFSLLGLLVDLVIMFVSC